MYYFVYCSDRPGALQLRYEVNEAHWAYMDRYADVLYARGPALTADLEGVVGSLHVVELGSDEAAVAFAEEEPYRVAGVFERVDVYRFEDRLGRSMWEFPGGDGLRFLVVVLDGRAAGDVERDGDLIVYGTLRRLDGSVAGMGACVQAADADAALAAVNVRGAETVTVRPWRFGGRS
jgi:uncharacterized protein YciI